MKTAAGNTAGAMTGFMGMGMATGANGMNAQSLFAMGQQPAAPQQQTSAADSWKCSCGAIATGKFCPECGSKKPEPKPAPLTVDYVAECEKSLTRRLDRKVRIVNGKRKGRFELEFYGQEDLQRLYDALLALGKTEEKPECLN